MFNRHVLSKIAKRSSNKIDNILFASMEKPLVFGIMLAAIWVAVHRLNLDASVYDPMKKAYQILTVINVTWFVSKFVGGLVDEYGNRTFNGRLLPLLKRGVGIAIWIVGIVTALKNVGVEVSALLGLLGVGGMATALAAQDSIKNIFGGVTIFSDRPFRIGDTIQVDNYEGVVQDIGWRSTRIKTYEQRIVTIPNFKLMDASVINISAEPERRVVVLLGLTYDTQPHKMTEAVELLKNIPKTVPEITAEVTATFDAFADSALVIRYVYYIRKSADIFDTKSKVNFEILNRFNTAGLNFAFPSQTVYLEKA
jgi:MscS family membrane protein